VKAFEVSLPADQVQLQGALVIPDQASGIVVFVHGSGSSRLSPRNRAVARSLQASGLATLLFDLLVHDEAERDSLTAEYRFDIPLLARRLSCVLDWLSACRETSGLAIGLFGASTGAAAALIVAAARHEVHAVVSRGGRPDLADEALARVAAPTLLIVGARDREVIELNRRASDQMMCERKLVLVPKATHLFEETGALERVARLAADWFVPRLSAPR
jgi:dienelactone hydrolase